MQTPRFLNCLSASLILCLLLALMPKSVRATTPGTVDDRVVTDEDTAVQFNVLDNDYDADGDSLVLMTFSNPTNGTLISSGDGAFTYTPNPDFNGTDVFDYVIRDDPQAEGVNPRFNDARVVITVRAVNDAPEPMDDSASTFEATPTTIDVLANDQDPDNDTLALIGFAQPANGLVTDTGNGTLSYTPNLGFSGMDTFSYLIDDGHNDPQQGNVVITVLPTNRAPVATNDFAVMSEDQSLTIDVLANDQDPDGDAIHVVGVSTPTSGQLSIAANDDGITFTPAPNAVDAQSFTYTIADTAGHTAQATVSVSINPINDAPVALNDTAETNAGEVLSVAVLTNDSDPDNDPLTLSAVGVATPPAHGTVSIQGDNTVRYVPTAGFAGTDSFSYEIRDPAGLTAAAVVQITINAGENPPLAQDDVAITTENIATTLNVLDNDSDEDGDTLAILTLTFPANGLLTIAADGAATYTPDPDFTGLDTFTYTITDGQNQDTATVYLIVNPAAAINQAPQGTADTATTDEDTPVTIDVLANDSDADGDPLSIDSFTQPAQGTVTLASNIFTYTPDANTTGTDTFTYTLADDNGGTDADILVTLTVNAVNDPPVARNDYAVMDEDGTLPLSPLDNDTDVESATDTLRLIAFTQPLQGTLILAADQKSLTYIPAPNTSGLDGFQYTVIDPDGALAMASVAIVINPINDAPTAIRDTAESSRGNAVSIDVLANDSDIDGDPLNVDTVTAPAHGTATIQANNEILYEPNAGFAGTDTFSYTIKDPAGLQSTATVSIRVTPANTPPIAVDDAIILEQDPADALQFNALANDVDLDGDSLTLVNVSQPTNGVVGVSQSGLITYTPDPGFTGTDTFTYDVSDGIDTSTATVTAIVNSTGTTPSGRSGRSAATPWQLTLSTDGAAVTLGMNGESDTRASGSRGNDLLALLNAGQNLVQDVRPLELSSSWDLLLDTTAENNPRQLEWDSTAIPEAGLFLQQDNGELIDMAQQQTLDLLPGAIHHLQIIYGVVPWDCNLQEGWNLISLPVQPLQPDPEQLFGDNISAIWAWRNGAYTPATEIHAGEAYWVYRRGGEITINLNGILVSSPVRDLAPGWNLIGPVLWTHPTPLALPLETTESENIDLGSWSWDGTAMRRSTNLNLGRGYWIQAERQAPVLLGH